MTNKSKISIIYLVAMITGALSGVWYGLYAFNHSYADLKDAIWFLSGVVAVLFGVLSLIFSCGAPTLFCSILYYLLFLVFLEVSPLAPKPIDSMDSCIDGLYPAISIFLGSVIGIVAARAKKKTEQNHYL